MSTIINRNITDLKPVLQRGLKELQSRFATEVKNMVQKGQLNASCLYCTIGVSETLRSIERQKEMVAEGKSQTMQSNHLTGQAFDFYIDNYPGSNIYPSVLVNVVGRIWTDMGGVWGGSWKGLVDSDHCEFIGGDEMEWERDVKPSDIPKEDTPSNFAKVAWDWGKENGITDGSNPQGIITREQVITMLYRYHTLPIVVK